MTTIVTPIFNPSESFPLSRSIDFVESSSGNYDRAVISSLPTNFGQGEFTLECYIRCLSNGTYALGDTTAGGLAQRQNWSNSDPTRYGANDWWFAGNFLLDGHNNNSNGAGTFDLQVANGRIRWLFGDGSGSLPTGGVWGVQGTVGVDATSVLDNQWHRVACVRRFSGASSSDLELWVDDNLEDVETSNVRTNMATTYWNAWSGWPTNQQNWMWGVEKQAYLGVISQYEDFKGQLGEVRFWNRALTTTELNNPFTQVQNNASGLEGVYRWQEGSGTTGARLGNSGGNMTLNNGVTWNTASPF